MRFFNETTTDLVSTVERSNDDDLTRTADVHRFIVLCGGAFVNFPPIAKKIERSHGCVAMDGRCSERNLLQGRD